MSLCGGCFTVSYCDAKCQKAGRAEHKEWCKELKARKEADRAAPPELAFDASGLNAAALRRAAVAGDAAAMSQLANCYAVGTGGVVVDLVEAFRWQERATEVPAPSAVAFCNLGVSYDFGMGTPKDPAEAVRLYTIAAEMGYAEAQFNLGMCLQRGEGIGYNAVKAFTWLKCAADAGHADAQNSVGFSLEAGRGVQEDTAAAIVYFRRAADQGHAIAMCNLGRRYAQGIGVPRNPSLAVLWLKRALNAGELDAANALATLATCLSHSEVHAMGAGILRALLDGAFVPVPEGAGKRELAALVLAIGEEEEGEEGSEEEM